jgi:hypothetical protein
MNQQKRSESVDSSVKVALIGAAATIAAAVITAAVTWHLQGQSFPEKGVQNPPPLPDAHAPAPSNSPREPRNTPKVTPKTGDPATSPKSAITLDSILDLLQLHHQRATFGAVAGVLDRDPATLFKGYPRRTARTAWVVYKDSGQPPGYKPTELPADFSLNTQSSRARKSSCSG